MPPIDSPEGRQALAIPWRREVAEASAARLSRRRGIAANADSEKAPQYPSSESFESQPKHRTYNVVCQAYNQPWCGWHPPSPLKARLRRVDGAGKRVRIMVPLQGRGEEGAKYRAGTLGVGI